jgi:hypothetical protein
MDGTVNRKVLTSWNDLIGDANRQIEAAKKRIMLLRKTVKDVTKLRDSGEAWPGDTANSLSIAMIRTTVFKTVPHFRCTSPVLPKTCQAPFGIEFLLSHSFQG